MNLLAFDCSTQACSVALLAKESVLLKHEFVPQYQAKKILFLIDALFREAGMTPQALTAIAVGIGPGSFTGLRIAASVAQGLAFGLGIPLVPISSLQILAQTAYVKYAETAVLVAMDARMDEVYWGEYCLDPSAQIMLIKQSDCLTKPEKCRSSIPFGAGSAFEVYNLPVQPSRIDHALLPSADAMLKIAIESIKKKGMIPPDELQLNYLRNEVVHKKGE